MKKIDLVKKIEAKTNLKVTPYEHRLYLCENGDVAAIWDCEKLSFFLEEDNRMISKKALKQILKMAK